MLGARHRTVHSCNKRWRERNSKSRIRWFADFASMRWAATSVETRWGNDSCHSMNRAAASHQYYIFYYYTRKLLSVLNVNNIWMMFLSVSKCERVRKYFENKTIDDLSAQWPSSRSAEMQHEMENVPFAFYCDQTTKCLRAARFLICSHEVLIENNVTHCEVTVHKEFRSCNVNRFI